VKERGWYWTRRQGMERRKGKFEEKGQGRGMREDVDED